MQQDTVNSSSFIITDPAGSTGFVGVHGLLRRLSSARRASQIEGGI